MDGEVESFLDSLPLNMKELVSALRQLIQPTAPEAKETIVWGGLSYHRPKIGGRVKGAVCLIVAKQGQVRLEFIHGVRLVDPACLLRGAQMSKRHVVIESRDMIDRPELADLIRQAANLDPTYWNDPTKD
jgi:hypothetical protein